jgi:DNA repair protein RadD
MTTLAALRPHQTTDLERIKAALIKHRRVVYALATGAGKTIVAAYLAGMVLRKGNRLLVLCHRRELIRQTVRKFAAFGIEAGVIAAGWAPDPDKLVQVASVQTLARRLDQLPEAALVIVDECHHAVAGQWKAILEHYADKYILGVRATPECLDGRGLAELFDFLVIGATTAQLVADGFLADLQIFTGQVPDLGSIKTVAGDYAIGALSDAMCQDVLLGDTVDRYHRHADGLPAIAFSCTVEHAQRVADQFKAAGYRAASVDGAMAVKERDRIITGLATGALQVVTSCDLISEGLDIPDVAAALLLRPTKSLVLFLQQVGRARRPKRDGSKAVILDHAGNVLRHGDPSQARLWSLEGRPARLRAEAAAREEEERARRRQCQEIAGQLREWSPEAVRFHRLATLPYRQALRECPDEQSLHEMAAARGYKAGWIRYVLEHRAVAAAARAERMAQTS